MKIEIDEKTFGAILEELHAIRDIAIRARFVPLDDLQYQVDDIIQHSILALRHSREAVIVREDPGDGAPGPLLPNCRCAIKPIE